MSRTYFVYILASEARQLYVGVTNDLERRLPEHRAGVGQGYAFRPGITRLAGSCWRLSFGSLALLGMTNPAPQP